MAVQARAAADGDGIPGLLPKPARPGITEIPAAEGFAPAEGVPVAAFADDAVLTHWLYACPAEEGCGEKLAAAGHGGGAAGAAALAGLRPLPAEMVVPDSWPDVTDAIDLKAVGGGEPDVRSVYLAVVANDRPRLVRVCHGAAGMNVSACMWVAGRQVAHGELLRLGAGAYPVVVEAGHGRDGYWIRWDLARLAPRFTEVTEAQIDEVHRWHVARWQATLDGAGADEDEMLSRIEFDPATIRGAEGFFRVGRSVNGRWWLIDPDGRAFYHKGCTGLNAGGIGGRRANLPPVPDETARLWAACLKQWRFNALGAWTTPEFFDKGIAFAETIEAYYVEPWLIEKFPDVFDPRWAANLDAKCREICTPLRDNRMLIGYFLDNERGFMDVLGQGVRIVSRSPTYRYAGPIPQEGLVLAAEPQLNIEGIGLLQFCLSLDESVLAARAAWEFVLSRHATPAGVGEAWGVEFGSKQAVRELTAREELLISEAYQEDLSDFVRAWVAQYYRVFTETIRRYDPNHLTLGMRHGGTPSPAVLEAEAEWADVVSRNNYRAQFYEAFDDCCRGSDRPVLNGEFSTHTDAFTLVRNPIEPPGGYDETTRQAIRAREALDRICTHPGVVGYTKYRWHGGGDKLWQDGAPAMHIVDPLRRANYRAVSIATSWDHPPRTEHGPLHGQVFVTLVGGSMSAHELPAPKAGAEPSVQIRAGEVALGLVCRAGTWDARVHGDGIRGSVTDQKTEGSRYHVTLEVKVVPGLFTRSPAEARYSIDLVRDDTKLEGTFEGTHNGRPVAGRAIGYLFRPAATVRL